MFRAFQGFCVLAGLILLSGCPGYCPSQYAAADSLIVEGTLPNFDDLRPCGGTDGECWAIGEVIITYSDGSVKNWTETLGRREFFIRSSTFGSSGRFDWSLHEPMGDAFTEDKEVESVRYVIELVNRRSGGSAVINLRTGICFEGVVQSEEILPPELDPFIPSSERDRCTLSERTVMKAEVEFGRSENCPSRDE